MYLSHLMIDVGDNPDRPRPGRLWLRNLYRVHQRLAMAFPDDQRRKHDPAFLAPYNPDDFPEQRHLADPQYAKEHAPTLTQVHTPRSDGAGFLFRVDPLPGGRAVIVVLSHEEPDWGYAFGLYPDRIDPRTDRPIGNAGHLLAAPPAKPRHYEPGVKAGERYRFRLTANPTKKTDTLSKEQRLAKIAKRHGRRVPVPTDALPEWLASRAERSGFRLVEPLGETLTTVPGYVYVNKTRESGKGQRLRSVRYNGLLEVVNPDTFDQALRNGIGPAKAYGFGLLSIAPLGHA